MIDLARHEDLLSAVMAFRGNDRDPTTDVIVVGMLCTRTTPRFECAPRSTRLTEAPPDTAEDGIPRPHRTFGQATSIPVNPDPHAHARARTHHHRSGPAGYTAAIHAAQAQLAPWSEGAVTAGGAPDEYHRGGELPAFRGESVLNSWSTCGPGGAVDAEIVTDDITSVDLANEIRS